MQSSTAPSPFARAGLH